MKRTTMLSPSRRQFMAPRPLRRWMNIMRERFTFASGDSRGAFDGCALNVIALSGSKRLMISGSGPYCSCHAYLKQILRRRDYDAAIINPIKSLARRPLKLFMWLIDAFLHSLACGDGNRKGIRHFRRFVPDTHG